jgi:hypothetical protein
MLDEISLLRHIDTDCGRINLSEHDHLSLVHSPVLRLRFERVIVERDSSGLVDTWTSNIR